MKITELLTFMKMTPDCLTVFSLPQISGTLETMAWVYLEAMSKIQLGQTVLCYFMTNHNLCLHQTGRTIFKTFLKLNIFYFTESTNQNLLSLFDVSRGRVLEAVSRLEKASTTKTSSPAATAAATY